MQTLWTERQGRKATDQLLRERKGVKTSDLAIDFIYKREGLIPAAL